METTKTITKLTGQTVFAMPVCAPSMFGTRGTSTVVSRLRGVVVLAENGLGLQGTDVSVVSGSGFTGLGGADSFETGLSRDWAIFGGGLELRDERPTQAPKAVAVAAKHGGYVRVSGAGAAKQDEQLINQAQAAHTGAQAIRMRAFRGPAPWSERT
ncbi:hypothetical protein [Kitasatospora sp. DSM 101779]|uniref:hypothetical protein n=1 Tax=Kitasatospora sp. DSM 101779 TaxID=2853165 RepID=UPI0021D90C61|nr:hypothetical protein [Kitasatospora sp. DSM 101779]MCU7822958.1 hypothetical protein [Kitasatospora sp. DSM 101779]